MKQTLKESYSVIIEFRDLAHTAKQFVRHPPQYPENLSNSVNIILLFLLRETLGKFNIFLHCFENKCININWNSVSAEKQNICG